MVLYVHRNPNFTKYGLFGTGEEWDREWEPRPTSLSTQQSWVLHTAVLSSPHSSPEFSTQQSWVLHTAVLSSPHSSPEFSTQQSWVLHTAVLSSPHSSPEFSTQQSWVLHTAVLSSGWVGKLHLFLLLDSFTAELFPAGYRRGLRWIPGGGGEHSLC